jgi:site-specific DNA recombinase
VLDISPPDGCKRERHRDRAGAATGAGEIAKLVQALKDGVPASVGKDALIALEAQQSELKTRLDRVAQPAPLLHPNMANLYREKVVQPAPGLQFEESRIAAAAWSLGR